MEVLSSFYLFVKFFFAFSYLSLMHPDYFPSPSIFPSCAYQLSLLPTITFPFSWVIVLFNEFNQVHLYRLHLELSIGAWLAHQTF